jgi:HEAT repeat protein
MVMIPRALITLALVTVAAPCLAGQPDEKRIAKLISELGADQYAAREKATRELRKIGPRARAALERASGSKDAEVQERSRMLLREIIWKMTPQLAARLGDFSKRFETYLKANEGQKLRLLSGLRSRAPVAAEAYILQAAREMTSNRAQSWLTGLLNIYASVAAEQALLATSRREERFCRSGAASALARFESEKATRRLLELLEDADAPVRRAAVESLGNRGARGRGAAAAVIKRLGDADETVQAAAARAAGRLGERKALAALWKLASSREVSVRIAAISAISALAVPDEKKVASALGKLLGDPLPAVRSTVLSALVDMRARSALPEIVKLLQDGDTDLAAGAAGALSVLGGKQEFGALRRAMKSEDRSLAASAGRALIVLGDEKSAPDAARMLFGKNAISASVIARALGATGDARWIPELIKAEKHWKAESFTLTLLEVRSSQLRDPSARKPLARLMAVQGGDLGWAYLLGGHTLFAESEKLLARATVNDMDNAGALSRLGIGQIQAGRAGQGIAKLRLAASMDPLSAINLNNFAWFLLTVPERKLRRPKEALEVATRARQLAPRTGYILDTYAWALHANGKTREAAQAIKEAISWSRPDNPGEDSVLQAHRARILAASGKPKAAGEQLRRTLGKYRRDPELALEAARAYCDLGLTHKAIAELGRMLDLGYPDLQTLRLDPELDKARKDPKFAQLLKRAEEMHAKLKAEFLEAGAAHRSDLRPPVEIMIE